MCKSSQVSRKNLTFHEKNVKIIKNCKIIAWDAFLVNFGSSKGIWCLRVVPWRCQVRPGARDDSATIVIMEDPPEGKMPSEGFPRGSPKEGPRR